VNDRRHTYLFITLALGGLCCRLAYISASFWQEPVVVATVPAHDDSGAGDVEDGNPTTDDEVFICEVGTEG